MEIGTSASAAERLPHSDEQGVNDWNIGGCATGFLLNFCFAPWICGTSQSFF